MSDVEPDDLDDLDDGSPTPTSPSSAWRAASPVRPTSTSSGGGWPTATTASSTSSRDELLAQGVSPRTLDDPDYVRRAGVLDDVEAFDAGFFGIGKRDAAIMDPQHRHFMECCWEALETSGHVPERFDGAIGVFAGCGIEHLPAQQPAHQRSRWSSRSACSCCATRRTTRTSSPRRCRTGSTSAVRRSTSRPRARPRSSRCTSPCRACSSFECDIALAGGSTIEVPHRRRLHLPGGRDPRRPTACCRAFDELSDGTVLTSGAGVVALRRLTDAIDDGDPILAVIKGSAVNNDGQRKVGYLAPSVDGHADVVKEALAVAGLSARDIQLLEAHGTGTSVGDPIEVAALTEAFRATTDDVGFCRLVSTKPNIGHLDTAAGVASLIKVVQAMRHETLPPIANHTAPSPLLDLERTPFVLSADGDAVAERHAPTRRGQLARCRRHQRPRRRRGGARPRRRPRRRCPSSCSRSPQPMPPRSTRPPGAWPTRSRATPTPTSPTSRSRSPRSSRHVPATRRGRDRHGQCRRSAARGRSQPGGLGDGSRRRAARWPSCSRAAARSTSAWRPGSTSASTSSTTSMREGVALRTRASRCRPRSAAPARCIAPTRCARRRSRCRRCSSRRSRSPASGWRGAWSRPRSSATASASTSPRTSPACSRFEDALDLIVARARLMDRVSGSGAAMLAVPLPVEDVRPLLGVVVVGGHGQRRRRVRHRRPARGRRAARQASHHRRCRADADPDRRGRPQLAARPDPARVPRSRPQHRVGSAAAAVPVEPHRHVDHRRAGDRPPVLGRPPASHGALRRLPPHGAGRRADGV